VHKEVDNTLGNSDELEEEDLSANSSSTLKSPAPSTVENTENKQDNDIATPQDASEDKGQESDGLLPARYNTRRKGKAKAKVSQACHAHRDR
jgi:hypothetical protein